MLLEEQVLLLILVSENEQHLSQLKGLEALLQFKDLHYVMIEDHHHDEIQVEFLEQDFDIHHRQQYYGRHLLNSLDLKESDFYLAYTNLSFKMSLSGASSTDIVSLDEI